MTIRSLILGFGLGLFVSVFTYFNDAVVNSTSFIGNFLPIGVLAVAVILVFLINPILRTASFKRSEVAIILVLGLAACGWSGSSFYRVSLNNVTMPWYWLKTNSNWQANHVMSYTPGASPKIAEGHIRNWEDFTETIVKAPQQEGTTAADRLWETLSPEGQRLFRTSLENQQFGMGQITKLVRAVNNSLQKKAFYKEAVFEGVELPEGIAKKRSEYEDLSGKELVRFNREALAAAMPELVKPPPDGSGVLVDYSEENSWVVDSRLAGRSEGNKLKFTELPWQAWWPAIRVWGGTAVVLGLASLCLALIVHPQWSHRELLAYPIARFVQETVARPAGQYVPTVAKNRLFWWAFSLMIALHALNGLHAWFPAIPEFSLQFDFSPLQPLFPNASQAPHSWGVFAPTLYPTVIAFSFFLTTQISFSLGISMILWIMFMGLLIGNGVPINDSFIQADKASLMRFGSYAGIAIMIFYFGRHYYTQLAKKTVGLGRNATTEIPSYGIWAARGLFICFVLAVTILHSAGLGVFWGCALVFLVLLMFVVLARLVAETGAFFLQSYWMPVGVLTALFGIEAVGPTTYILLAMACMMLVPDVRTTLMPFLTNALRIADTNDAGPPRRKLTVVIGLMVVLSFLAAGAYTMYVQYNSGIDQRDGWAKRNTPTIPFNGLADKVSTMSRKGTLSESVWTDGLDKMGLANFDGAAYGWIAAGLGIVLLTAFARLRLPWWPLHPVAFLVWGTYPLTCFWASFLIGSGIKGATVRLGGAKGYHVLMPFMVGIVVGELSIGFLWMLVSIGYFMITGSAPETYYIFPG